MKKRFLSALLALLLLWSVLPQNALASVYIEFNPAVHLVFKGASGTLKPHAHKVSGTLKWKTNNSAVVSVTQKGAVKAKKVGKATITAYSGSIKGRCRVVVLPKSITIKVGEKYTLPHAGPETYEVGSSSVARVSSKGVVTGKTAGGTVLKVKYHNQTRRISVKVKPADSRVVNLAAAKKTDRIVLVEYKGGSKATLSIHQKKSGHWVELYSCTAYVGKNGIDKTREGDKRTPTGTFNLTTPFGIEANPGSAQKYLQVTKYHYWCGTSSSKYYNQLVDTRKVDYNSSSSDEKLIKYDDLYDYCMFIDYNKKGVADKGSCIFLHCSGSHKYTSGCIAVSKGVMKGIIKWAKAGTKIVITKPL